MSPDAPVSVGRHQLRAYAPGQRPGTESPANVVAPDVTLNPGELFVRDALASQVTGAPQARIRSGKRLKAGTVFSGLRPFLILESIPDRCSQVGA